LGPPSAVNSGVTGPAVYAITRDDASIYIAGDFTNWDGIANADYIVSWDGSSYSAMGTGADGRVRAAVIKPDGTLIVGGNFTDMGGVTCRSIAAWNGSSWSALGPPATAGIVDGLALDNDGLLYVCGTFSNWDNDTDADKIATWDGSSWGTPGNLAGASGGSVWEVVAAADGTIYMVGDFTSIGGTAAGGVVSWDGSSYSSMASSQNGSIYAATIDNFGNLIVGGTFTTIDGVSANRVASWNGVSWLPLGVGVADGQVLKLSTWRGFIIATGTFTDAGGFDALDRMVLWNGYLWATIDIDLPGAGPAVQALMPDGDDLYIGFDQSGTGYYSGTTSVTPSGNTRTYPVITIDRSGGTTATLTNIINETTGASLWFDFDIQDGEAMTIDLRPGKQSVISSYWGQIQIIFQGSDASDFYLLPNTANDIKAFVTTTGAPTITTTIKWVESYWSVD
jgi:hypothetical protein